MPIRGRTYDLMLGGKGYQLARPGNRLARAWQRNGVPDTPTVDQPRMAAEYGGLPPQIEYPEVWNDWSGGFGYAYRHPNSENTYPGFFANPNTYHWAENFDPRFERQLVHAQKLRLLSDAIKVPPEASLAGVEVAVESFLNWPAIQASVNARQPVDGQDIILVLANRSTIRTSGNPSMLSPRADGDIDRYAWYNITGRHGFRAAIFGSFLYVPSLEGTQFFQIKLDQPETIDGVSPGGGICFVTAGNRLWRALGGIGRPVYVNSIAVLDKAGVMAAANWSATLNVGNGHYALKDMITLDDQLYLGFPDGIYAGDQSGTFVNIMPELARQFHPDNCRDLTIMNHQIITPHSAGLFAYDPSPNSGVVQEIGPQRISNRSPIQGRFRCTAALGQWLYGGLYTGSLSYLMAAYQDPRTREFTWHSMQRLPNVTKVHRIHIDGITAASNGAKISNRMWIATDGTVDTGGTAPLYVIPIPDLNGNPLVPSLGFTANYANSARMDLGNTDGRTPTTPKIYRSCEVWADNLDGSQRWGLMYYTIDQGARTLLGTINSSPRSVIYFPNNDGSFVMGQSIELSLESYIASGSEATTPAYRSIILRQMQVPRSIDVITAVVDVGDNVMDRQGTRMRPGAVQLAELRGLVATGPVPMVDLTGATSWAKLLAPVEEQESWQDGTGIPSVLATIKIALLSFTTT